MLGTDARSAWKFVVLGLASSLGMGCTSTVDTTPVERDQKGGEYNFGVEEVAQTNFVAYASPLTSGFKLVILEQKGSEDLFTGEPAKKCWQEHEASESPKLIELLLNDKNFNHEGVCGVYQSQSNYSLRIGNRDLSLEYDFLVRETSAGLELIAKQHVLSGDSDLPSEPIVVGRTNGTPGYGNSILQNGVAANVNDSSGGVGTGVVFELEPGFQIGKRTHNSQTLDHVYIYGSSWPDGTTTTSETTTTASQADQQTPDGDPQRLDPYPHSV